MNQFIHKLKYGWSFMRILRFLLGFILLGEAIYKTDWMFGIMGLVLLAQAVFNVACCSGGACETDISSSRPSGDGIESTTFKEIK